MDDWNGMLLQFPNGPPDGWLTDVGSRCWLAGCVATAFDSDGREIACLLVLDVEDKHLVGTPFDIDLADACGSLERILLDLIYVLEVA